MSRAYFTPQSLQARITLAVLAIVLATAAGIAMLTREVLTSDVEFLIRQQQASTLALVADEVEQEIADRLHALQDYADTIDAAQIADGRALQVRLEHARLLLDLFNGGCFVTGTDGTPVADMPLPPMHLSLNYADRDYIIAALRDGRASVGRPVVGRKLGNPVLTMAAPIRAPDGRIVGAMAGIVNLDQPSFLDRIGAARFGRSGGIALIDAQHRLVVTGTDKRRVMQALPAPGANAALDRLLAAGSDSAVLDGLQEGPVLAAMQRVPTPGWQVAVFLPTEEAYGPARHLSQLVWLISLGASALAGLFAWWTLRRQLAPMAEAAKALADQSSTALPAVPLPVHGNDELARLIVSFNHVLTTLAQREQSLTQSRELLATIVDSVPVRIFWKGRDLRYLGCNRAFAQDAGRERPADLVGRDDHELAWAAQADVFRADDEAVIRSGMAKLDFEEASVRPDGTTIVLRTSKMPLKQPDGGVIGVLGIYEDITERRNAAVELERHRGHLTEMVAQRTAELETATSKLSHTQFAMDRVGIGITWVDCATGRHLYANAHAAQALGYTVEELLGMHVWDIDRNFPPEAFHAVVAQIRDAGFDRIETTQTTRDGRTVPVEMTIYYQGGIGGVAPFLITFRTDTTERREKQQALLRAKESAESANAAKTAFLTSMSHEIRTPLNAILGMTHLMRRGTLSDDQRRQLARIDGAGRHLLALINDILDLAKIEAGRLDIAHEDFHLPSLLDSVATMARSAAADKPLRIATESAGVPAWLNGDPVRLRQALLNFAGNAVKFTGQGQIDIRAALMEDANDGIVVRFEVRDTGVGIPLDQQVSLFQDFGQVQHDGRDRTDGTGLGLAITRRLAELMDGQVGVDSKEGVGSRFWFTARLQRGVSGEVPVVELPLDEADAWQRLAAHSARLLLAEDNQVNREVVLGLLDGSALVTDVAEDGEEAVRLASERSYDLVLMDMRMPRMDGVAATRAIRALPGWSRVPIVALTANAFSADRDACLAAGMNDFISKPVAPDNFYSVLVRWLDAKGVEPAPAPASGALAKVASTAGQETDALLRRLARVDQVDVARGVAALLGRRDRYLDLLVRFVRHQGATVDRIAEALAAGDLASALFGAHTLKGAAATLGLDGLARQLSILEQELRAPLAPGADRPTGHPQIAAVSATFATLTDVLDA